MNAKTHNALTILLIAMAFFIAGCEKKKTTTPEPVVLTEKDKELQSSIDVSYAAMVITDIDMICAFLGEANLAPKFYLPSATSIGSYGVNRDTVNKTLFISFNNTKCLDGRLRDGTISMNYNVFNVNARYYRSFEFVGKVSFFGYKVDGWSIELRNTFLIKNLLSTPNYNPSNTNLSWSLNGDFDLKHPTDDTKNMHVNVNLVKTLANTSSPEVFPTSKTAAINWSLAVVEYKGTMVGETSKDVPFTYEINNSQPLVRDFKCFPDDSNGANTEYHPFVNGSASFKTSNSSFLRSIYYGAEDNTINKCENVGAVKINDTFYPIEFTKEYK